MKSSQCKLHHYDTHPSKRNRFEYIKVKKAFPIVNIGRFIIQIERPESIRRNIYRKLGRAFEDRT